MKIYVFVPTGDFREVKNGEYYKCNDGVSQWTHPNPLFKADIFQRHEIEAPDSTDRLDVVAYPYRAFECPGSFNFSRIASIPIPRKRKVKKWQWLRINKDNYGRPRASISSWLTDEQASEELHGGSIKIPETEIEVEE